MTKLNVTQIRDLALEIVSKNPGGIHYGEIVKQIATTHRATPPNTICGSVFDLVARFPEKVVKRP